jgi:hypothetical protein
MYIKNFNKNGGALYIVPLFIVLGIISLSFLYFLVNRNISNKQKANNLKQQNINTPLNITTTIKEKESLKGELILELGLSSLSRTKGKADIYWDSKEGFSTGKPKIAIATPLDLVDGLKITNNTNKTVLFVEINNENKESLKFIPSDDRKATPIILLPEKFIKNDKEEIICKNRDLFSKSVNNICIFSEPIIIKPGETITLSPQLFVVPSDFVDNYGPPYTRDQITFLNNKNSKNHFYLTLKNGKKYIYLSNIFKEYDEISESETFNVGGFILIDSKNNNFINKIFNFKTIDGQKITPKIKLTNGITIKQFQLPSIKSIPEKNKFNEDVLDWQVFLYRNNFMKKEDINGKYDDKTITAIKKLQKSAGIVETGKIDWATMHIANAFDTGYRYYENYGDEAQLFSLDSSQPYFRLFSIGMNKVELNKDFSSSSLIKFIKKDNCIEDYSKLCGYYLDGTKRNIFGDVINILNNTPETQLCTLSDQNGLQIKNFKINPNEMYSITVDSDEITASTMHKLQCGDKYLEIELYPLKEEKGR